MRLFRDLDERTGPALITAAALIGAVVLVVCIALLLIWSADLPPMPGSTR